MPDTITLSPAAMARALEALAEVEILKGNIARLKNALRDAQEKADYWSWMAETQRKLRMGE